MEIFMHQKVIIIQHFQHTTNWTIYDPSSLNSTAYSVEIIEDLITVPVEFNTGNC